MADKEIYELEIEIDNRDVDKTQKKLRSLDKLLQQTQHRAGLLGKTRIKPAVTLDDRFSSAARKIGDTLTRLHRTTVKPVAELDDRASKAAVKLYATLAALSASRWRVSVAGVDWETAVGDSFTKWISSDGKSTMQRISSSIASALGGGLKDVMIQALGLGDAVKASGTGNSGGSSGKPKKSSDLGVSGEGASSLLSPSSTDIIIKEGNNKSNNAAKKPGFSEESDTNPFTASLPDFMKPWDYNEIKRPGFYEDGYYDVSSFLKDGFKTNTFNKPPKVPSQIPDGLSVEKESFSSIGTRGSFSSSNSKGNFDSKKSSPLSDFFTKVWDEFWKDRFKDALNVTIPLLSKALNDYWKTNWTRLRSRLAPRTGTRILDGIADWGRKTEKFFEKVTPFVNKKMGGYAGLIFDGLDIASAKTPRERYQKVSSAVLSGAFGTWLAAELGALFTAAGPEATPIGVMLGSAVGGTIGGYAGDFLGGFIYDLFHGKIEQKPQAYSDRKMAPGVQGITPPEPYVPRVMGTPVPNYYEVPEELRSKIGGPGYFNKPVAPVNVSLSQGALNLTVNKDEINYDELAKAAGLRIANEVRFAMQNLK